MKTRSQSPVAPLIDVSSHVIDHVDNVPGVETENVILSQYSRIVPDADVSVSSKNALFLGVRLK